ncbi:SMP-30/gluconolactonase/LRE family protein [Tellurirhabdus bombi]|uniref:SMP-30/gluconolactonase/LRE family protein n=1 Tax=Tellurirhabdus bombi TaxID=2907205 RepID=UPI001F364077|nr:ATP-binding protein [Tellurirhabdus bombi]
MSRLLLPLICLTLALLGFDAPKKEKKLVKVWETDTTLRVPESVLYNPKDGFIYVSNIDGKPDGLDGNGFISRLTIDGKIEKLKWVVGLNAPKGMGIYNNRLYVTDLHRLVAINLTNGQAENTWDATDEKPFLNDVSIAKDGTVYVSDNRNNKIYRLKDKQWGVWMEGGQLDNPNGLLVVGKKLMVGSTKIGALQALDIETKTIMKIADGMGNTDGIVTDGKKNYFVSDWNGQLFYITAEGQKQQMLDSREQKTNTADIDYIANRKLLIVPTFFKNQVVAYRVE